MFETIRAFVDVLPFLLSTEFLFQLIMFSDLILKHFRNRGTHDELAIFRVIGKFKFATKTIKIPKFVIMKQTYLILELIFSVHGRLEIGMEICIHILIMIILFLAELYLVSLT